MKLNMPGALLLFSGCESRSLKIEEMIFVQVP